MARVTSVQPPPEYDVRLARPGEERQICAVCAAGFTASSEGLLSRESIHRQVRTYYNPKRVHGEILAAGGSPSWQGYVVAVTPGGEVLGAAGGGVLGGVGHLFVIYLQLQLCGCGIGTALLDHVTEQQRRAGATHQRVSVTEGNEMGIPFYLAKGFTVEERVPFLTHEDGRVEAWSLRMVRAIGS
jgi:GNAT superfamily N-acetyltransferase